ncbi:hypothetical protein [Pontixanthobacter aquaemixtae]|uniref:Uncharacterized protein n=1 Tax=Pontixanthobacter aquaemixtae TaxID=1958940 RepID=A0A844ZWL6_9SPHN|nr:hypothetical protein [Pontixanthobacter aquaemixtae]MXO91147.1 hypothetical protein [Pontixanthobacter aquaemixtae]
MSVIAKLKSTEAIIAAIVSLVAVVAKYTAVSNLLDLPDGVDGVGPHLATAVVIIAILLIVYWSENILDQKPMLIGLGVAVMAAAGVYLASNFASDIRSQTVEVQCVDFPRTTILRPNEPSERLATLIDDGGGLETAWCEEEKVKVRSMVRSENSGQVFSLNLWLILAESLLAIAVTLLAWLIANRPGGSDDTAGD